MKTAKQQDWCDCSRQQRSAGNKKGRGENAPTFLIITYSPVPVHPWSRASGDGGHRERQKPSSALKRLPMIVI